MTIDEAIRCERKRAEESRDMYVCLLETSYQYQIKHKEEMDNYKQSAEEHEQLAEWLEDYKRVKKWKDEIMEEFCRYDASSIEELMQRARNKAIDDVFQWLCNSKYAAWEIDVDREGLYFDNEFVSFDEIAQQLKDGGTDE